MTAERGAELAAAGLGGKHSIIGEMRMRGGQPDCGAAAETTIWLARHTEVHNPALIYYGRLPRMGLSAEGRRQAERLADFFADRPLAAIYTSPLLRARKVAQAIGARHTATAVRVDRDLLEVRTRWQGRPHAALESVKWDLYADARPPHDETMEAILRRMERWLARVARRHRGGEVLGVTHGDPLLILLAGLQGLSLEGVTTLVLAAGTGSYIPVGTVARVSLDAQGRACEIAVLVPPYQDAVRLTLDGQRDQ